MADAPEKHTKSLRKKPQVVTGGSGLVSHHHSHQAYAGLQCCLSAQTTEQMHYKILQAADKVRFCKHSPQHYSHISFSLLK